MLRTAGPLVLAAILGAVLSAGGIFAVMELRDSPSQSDSLIRVLTAVVDPTAQPPTHNAVEIVKAATAQGWGQDAGCSNPNWFPLGVRLKAGGHGAARQWGFTCVTGQSGNRVTGAICVTMDDTTLAIDSSIGQLCVY